MISVSEIMPETDKENEIKEGITGKCRVYLQYLRSALSQFRLIPLYLLFCMWTDSRYPYASFE